MPALFVHTIYFCHKFRTLLMDIVNQITCLLNKTCHTSRTIAISEPQVDNEANTRCKAHHEMTGDYKCVSSMTWANLATAWAVCSSQSWVPRVCIISHKSATSSSSRRRRRSIDEKRSWLVASLIFLAQVATLVSLYLYCWTPMWTQAHAHAPWKWSHCPSPGNRKSSSKGSPWATPKRPY